MLFACSYTAPVASAPRAAGGRPSAGQPTCRAASAPITAPGSRISSRRASRAFAASDLRGHRGSVACRSVGDSAIEGWLDLTSLVTSGGNDSSEVGDLASKIGSEVYMDMNGWHVYLKDMKFNRDLATVMYTSLVADGYDRGMVETVCKQVPISLGGGKVKVSLFDVLPAFCVDDFERILEDFARDL